VIQIHHNDEDEQPARRHYRAHVTVALDHEGRLTIKALYEAVAAFQNRVPPWATANLMGTELYVFWSVLAANLPAVGPDVAP